MNLLMRETRVLFLCAKCVLQKKWTPELVHSLVTLSNCSVNAAIVNRSRQLLGRVIKESENAYPHQARLDHCPETELVD